MPQGMGIGQSEKRLRRSECCDVESPQRDSENDRDVPLGRTLEQLLLPPDLLLSTTSQLEVNFRV